MLARGATPPKWIARTVVVATLAGAISLPVWINKNDLSRHDMISLMASAELSKPVQAALKWTLAVEPLIYPVGNRLLPFMAFTPIQQLYLNREASITDSKMVTRESIEQLNIQMPMTTRAAVMMLEQLGHANVQEERDTNNPTLLFSALRKFQAENGLEPTGSMNVQTINALRAAAEQR